MAVKLSCGMMPTGGGGGGDGGPGGGGGDGGGGGGGLPASQTCCSMKPYSWEPIHTTCIRCSPVGSLAESCQVNRRVDIIAQSSQNLAGCPPEQKDCLLDDAMSLGSVLVTTNVSSLPTLWLHGTAGQWHARP